MGRSRSISTIVTQWHHALSELAAHNGSVEVVLLGKDEREVAVIRTRLLRVDRQSGSLFVEKPVGQPAADAVRSRLVVRLVIQHGQSRLKATSTVVDVSPYRLNDQLRVIAIELSPPSDIESAQRRSRFRLHTGGLKMPPVRLVDTQDRSFGPLKAQLHDLSDRGAGVIVRLPQDEADAIVGRTFHFALHLPGEARPMEIDGHCLRVQNIGSRVQLLGIEFMYSSPMERQHCDRVIQQFSVAQQRNQLRRLRGAG